MCLPSTPFTSNPPLMFVTAASSIYFSTGGVVRLETSFSDSQRHNHAHPLWRSTALRGQPEPTSLKMESQHLRGEFTGVGDTKRDTWKPSGPSLLPLFSHG
ncbi:hypothetical protein BGZ61DRAFT_121023 [Ilyonectria robusta]|uniref:uncharacterized protein n=1 Tax=Ilyonectria robusta TaxID=1079257 RepID=UPI001E8D264E|nr:uncharacterized protein BGZ61DRAFT_121023 [Ilyonectria robusta]KAH8666083.1 hypothetical protein BGZ61DRAFT_121023 [Ilyonectria robusta]